MTWLLSWLHQVCEYPEIFLVAQPEPIASMAEERAKIPQRFIIIIAPLPQLIKASPDINYYQTMLLTIIHQKFIICAGKAQNLLIVITVSLGKKSKS